MYRGLTFDDVALVPAYNTIASRTLPIVRTKLTKNSVMAIPIVASNMESVISLPLARVLKSYGSIPILHRYQSIDSVCKMLAELEGNAFISWGVNDYPRLRDFLMLTMDECMFPLGICLDVAHGHSLAMIKMIESIKKDMTIEVLAGDVCTSRACLDLINAGADGISVGIGPGSACTTRGVTGFGVPQFTALQDCKAACMSYQIPILCDGGIRGSADILKALAAGADSVMIGKLFAGTAESGAKKEGGWITPPYRPEFIDPSLWFEVPVGPTKALYRGQASESFQNAVLGGVKEGTVPEGEDFWVPISGSASELIDKLLSGTKSGLTYAGAMNIKEFKRNVRVIEVTPSYGAESGTRP